VPQTTYGLPIFLKERLSVDEFGNIIPAFYKSLYPSHNFGHISQRYALYDMVATDSNPKRKNLSLIVTAID
jgi:hypothetical protein